MKLKPHITNGLALIVIGMVHTKLAITAEGFGSQFLKFAHSYFFRISTGLDQLPAVVGKTDFETFAAFWFFYFGVLLLPLGLLVHGIERDNKLLPHSFTISYLVVVLVGSYMVPNSGMTVVMLPHAVFMLIWNVVRQHKQRQSA